jgi:hypothetical protein
MLLTIILWIIQGLIILAYGRFLLRILSRISRKNQAFHPSFTLTFLSGIILVTTLASLLSFGINLSALAVGLIIFGAGVILLWEVRQNGLKHASTWLNNLHFSKSILLLVLLVFGLVIDLSTRRPANPDTGIYHAQAIQWMETYPIVPGLGNLHTRFAYNSSWLVINALFSFAFSGVRSFHTLPGLSYFLFCLAGIGALLRVAQKRGRFSDWFLILLLPLSFMTISPESSSPGTDLPTVLLTWILLSEWMAHQEDPDEQPLRPAVISLAGVFALTVKLSAAALLFFPIFFFIQGIRRQGWRFSAGILLSGMLILTPWMGRNIFLSGYLIYPEPEIDLFNLDWKIPAGQAATERLVIQAWARIPREDAQKVLGMPLQTWADIWYQNLPIQDRVMLWGIFLVTAGAGLLMVFAPGVRRRLTPFFRRYLFGWGVVLVGLIYWFFNAPDFRFGIGIVLAGLAFGILPWVAILQDWILRNDKLLLPGMAVFLAICWMLWIRGIEPHTLLERLVAPDDYTAYSTAPCQIKDRTILCAQWYDECGYAQIPCIPKPNPNVELRGLDLKSGFRHYP